MKLPIIHIHQAKVNAILRFHPWVFSGAIKELPTDLAEDTLVELQDSRDKFLALGYYTKSNIAVRILSFKPIESIEQLWFDKLNEAFDTRKILGFIDDKHSNCYRLVHAEGDGIPGLIIDWYNGVLVVQAHTVFIAKNLDVIAEVLKKIYGEKLTAIYSKSAATLPKHHHLAKDGFIYGEQNSVSVLENNCLFDIDFVKGQKTGFFLDQRENRALLARYTKHKRVLNTFCYTGGFSIYAALAGAEKVVSVDVSQKAIDLTEHNVSLNAIKNVHSSFTSDIFDFFKSVQQDDFDIMILDPPAFAKNVAARHQAIKAYTRLNETALQKIKKGGIIFTFSCSQVVNIDMFKGAVIAAAIAVGRDVKILHQLTQPPDHPINAFHPEGNYLKGLVLFVN